MARVRSIGMPILRSFHDGNDSPQEPTGGKLFVGSLYGRAVHSSQVTFLCGDEMARLFAMPPRVTAGTEVWAPSDYAAAPAKLSNGKVDIGMEWKYDWDGSVFSFPSQKLVASHHGPRRCLRTLDGKVVVSAWHPWKDSDLQKNIRAFFWHDDVTLGVYWPAAIYLTLAHGPYQAEFATFMFLGTSS